MNEPITNIDEAMLLLRRARGVLADWDGCLAFGDEMSDAGATFAETVSDRLVILSNNSTATPAEFTKKLVRAGVQLTQNRIKLAGAETLQFLAEHHADEDVMLVASDEMHAMASDLALRITRENPSIVALLRDVAFSYSTLASITAAISHGASLIVSNIDHAHPGPGGLPIPETGALLASVKRAAKLSSDQVTVIGKPEPLLFERAAWALKLAPSDCVMIGDNPETDGLGAQKLGMPCILVGQGGLALDEIAERLNEPSTIGVHAAR